MFQWLPWKILVKFAARRYGVLDPATLLARLRGFAQPSEVAEPMELLRAGIVFHARGLVNAKAIQHNLDWVWPFWVERQFNPEDPSFIPRAFSFSHINLTHRNWTAVGSPDIPAYPIIDPRGLVTPLHDGWSMDFWIVTASGKFLLPSKLSEEEVSQKLSFGPTLTVQTHCVRGGLELDLSSHMETAPNEPPQVLTRVAATSDEDGWLAVAIRPYNPEGVQFIHRIELKEGETEFEVNGEATVKLGSRPDSIRMAHYAEGDVYLDLPGSRADTQVTCDVGLATAAALYPMSAGVARKLTVGVTLERDVKENAPTSTWSDVLADTARLDIGDTKAQFLYDAAVRSLILLSADDMVPGPYTYRRFWFRDACLMLHPLMLIGLMDRAGRILSGFPARQTMAGYFLSQEGEWDSNGQVLWINSRYAELGGKLNPTMETSLRKGAAWLERKRLGPGGPSGTHGLLPAGFSAEHLGPNDYYYWDDYWACAGLKEIARYWDRNGDDAEARKTSRLADEFFASINASINSIPDRRAMGAIPAAPGRRMDAGAVGSMVADYPLHLYPPGHPKILATAKFLVDRCFCRGAFFQEMIHSGMNAYLTLDLAQTLLRAGDDRFADLMRRVAELASPTGQWPEAIHPHTLGGCMGDGQHGWAAAEWIMMVRNCFVREEGETLIIGSGILPEWRRGGHAVSYGPTLTRWGPITVRLTASRLNLDCDWKVTPPPIKIAVPGFASVDADHEQVAFELNEI